MLKTSGFPLPSNPGYTALFSFSPTSLRFLIGKYCMVLHNFPHFWHFPSPLLLAPFPPHPPFLLGSPLLSSPPQIIHVVSCMVLILLFYDIAAKLGANAILGVSLAVCKAGAAHKVTNRQQLMIFCIPYFLDETSVLE